MLYLRDSQEDREAKYFHILHVKVHRNVVESDPSEGEGGIELKLENQLW